MRVLSTDVQMNAPLTLYPIIRRIIVKRHLNRLNGRLRRKKRLLRKFMLKKSEYLNKVI